MDSSLFPSESNANRSPVAAHLNISIHVKKYFHTRKEEFLYVYGNPSIHADRHYQDGKNRRNWDNAKPLIN